MALVTCAPFPAASNHFAKLTLTSDWPAQELTSSLGTFHVAICANSSNGKTTCPAAASSPSPDPPTSDVTSFPCGLPDALAPLPACPALSDNASPPQCWCPSALKPKGSAVTLGAFLGRSRPSLADLFIWHHVLTGREGQLKPKWLRIHVGEDAV